MFPGFTFEALQHLKHFKGEIIFAANKMNDKNKRIKMILFNNYAMRIDRSSEHLQLVCNDNRWIVTGM
jgi:translation initiation factor IF-2